MLEVKAMPPEFGMGWAATTSDDVGINFRYHTKNRYVGVFILSPWPITHPDLDLYPIGTMPADVESRLVRGRIRYKTQRQCYLGRMTKARATRITQEWFDIAAAQKP